jgi:hypothetical protein
LVAAADCGIVGLSEYCICMGGVMGNRRTRRSCRKWLAISAAAGAVSLSFTHRADAQSDSWTAGNGNWSTAANWSNGVPTAGTTVSFSFTNTSTTNRTINYDYTGPNVTLGPLNIDTTGGGTDTFSMTTNGLTLITEGAVIGQYGTASMVQSAGQYLGIDTTVDPFGQQTFSPPGRFFCVGRWGFVAGVLHPQRRHTLNDLRNHRL